MSSVRDIIGALPAKAAFFDKLLFLQAQGAPSLTDVTIAYGEPPLDAFSSRRKRHRRAARV